MHPWRQPPGAALGLPGLAMKELPLDGKHCPLERPVCRLLPLHRRSGLQSLSCNLLGLSLRALTVRVGKTQWSERSWHSGHLPWGPESPDRFTLRTATKRRFWCPRSGLERSGSGRTPNVRGRCPERPWHGVCRKTKEGGTRYAGAPLAEQNLLHGLLLRQFAFNLKRHVVVAPLARGTMQFAHTE